MSEFDIRVAHRGALTEVRESDAGKPGRYTVRIIVPGQGSSGIYVAENLAASVGLFKAGTPMYMDHPTASEDYERPERSVRDLAGKLVEDAAVGDDGALYAVCEVYPSYNEIIREKFSDIGVSINAWCESALAPDGIVPPFAGVTSIDFVTRAGAGGALLEVLECAERRTATIPEEETMADTAAIAEAIAEAIAPLAASVKELREAFDAAALKKGEEKDAKKKDDEEKEDEDKKKRESMDAAMEAAAKIAESDLPEAARARVRESVLAGVEVEKAIEAEREYIKSVGSARVGEVKENGSSEEPYVVKNFR